MGHPLAFANKMIDFTTGRGVSTTYLCALTADPGTAAVMTSLSEDSTTGYVRQAVTWAAPVVPADSSDPKSVSAADVSFGPYTAAQANPITHLALVTAGSGTTGEIRYSWALESPFQAGVGDSMLVSAGSIDYGVFVGDGSA